jgi:hypothetical protein
VGGDPRLVVDGILSLDDEQGSYVWSGGASRGAVGDEGLVVNLSDVMDLVA